MKRLYIYTKIHTLPKNQDNLRYFFIHKKPDTLRSMIFHKLFRIGIHIFILRMTLWVTWCLCRQKSRHFKKIKTVSVTFFYAKILTLCVTRFFTNFWIVGGVGAFLCTKKMHFTLNFNIQKTMHFPLRFYKQKGRHFASHFIL